MYVCIQMCLQIPLFLIVTFLQQPAATTSMTQLAPRKATNPFLRWDVPEVQKAGVGM